MTRVNFYVLSEKKINGRNLFACRLLEKIYKQGNEILLHVADEQQANTINDLLWTWKQGSFIPHEIHSPDKPKESPILITHDPDTKTEMRDVLINLASDVPLFFSQFERVVEVVDPEAKNRQSARQRYRFYQERGYPLETHNIDT